MSNIAALCYSDAADWWMGDTPLLSSHTHSLCVTAPASSWACLVEQWRETKRLTWVEHGVSAAWGYKRATGFIAIGWGTSRGGSMTQLQHHDTAAQQLSLSSLFFLSLQLSSRLSHGGWYAGFKAIMTFLLWNTSDMSCYGNIQYQLHICTYQKHSRDCLFSHSSSSYLFLFP